MFCFCNFSVESSDKTIATKSEAPSAILFPVMGKVIQAVRSMANGDACMASSRLSLITFPDEKKNIFKRQIAVGRNKV